MLVKAISYFFWLIFLALFFAFLTTTLALAKENQFINIVNPVRVVNYNKDPVSSLRAEYVVLQGLNLPATWLVTDDVLENQSMVQQLKVMDSLQEVGIFLEVTEDFANKSGVKYNKTDSWHRANSIFLVGYSQSDRIKLIDTAFNKFKEVFGYFPTSVGAWWIDGYSLEYMQKKYGIKANLGLADQYSTDGYQVWGTYFSTPFYPNKYHSGTPANSNDNKLNLVTIQWAARDPLNSYGEADFSRYSTQDYLTYGLTDEYFQKLITLYASKNNNSFGQVTFGLEADLSGDIYQTNYVRQLKWIKNIASEKGFEITTMSDFASFYLSSFPNFSLPQIIQSSDLLGQKKQVVWYQSPHYRAGFIFDQASTTLQLIDLRPFFNNFQEPFYQSPNGQINLYINTPSLIDKVTNPNFYLDIKTQGELSLSKDQNILDFGKQKIIFKDDQLEFLNFNNADFKQLISNPYFEISKGSNQITLKPINQFKVEKNGYVFRDLSIKSTFFLSRPKVKIILMIGGVAIFLLFLVLFRLKRKKLLKFSSILLLVFVFLTATVIFKATQLYQVDQSEIDALLHLKLMLRGNVVVYDHACLVCQWDTNYPPAIYGNKRFYVRFFSDKPIIYDKTIFETTSRKAGQERLKSLNAKYIYLTKFENYQEKLPFSPGDYNVEKVFENSSAQIWSIKN